LAAKAITKFTKKNLIRLRIISMKKLIIFQTEFDEVVKFEIGAIINQKTNSTENWEEVIYSIKLQVYLLFPVKEE
jgi:hypothetical protein